MTPQPHIGCVNGQHTLGRVRHLDYTRRTSRKLSELQFPILFVLSVARLLHVPSEGLRAKRDSADQDFTTMRP